jgi:site-specific recombinase XerD
MNDDAARFADYLTTKGLSPLTISSYRSDLAQLSHFLGRRKLAAASSIVRFTSAGSVLRFFCTWFSPGRSSRRQSESGLAFFSELFEQGARSDLESGGQFANIF